MTREIRLTNSEKVALVDDEDYVRVGGFSNFCLSTSGGITVRTTIITSNNTYLSIANIVMQDYERKYVWDHKNRNPLDNRKENLRIANRQQNTANSKYENINGYRGVRFDKRNGKYYAQIGIDRKRIHLGTFNTKEEAAKCYDEAALEEFGEFAMLNFPKKEN